jgi:DNA replication and repair protein RecF
MVLQNFRSYKKSTYDFEKFTIIIGPNTAGKSNLIESIFLLSSGKSSRAERDAQMVRLGNEMGRVSAHILQDLDGQSKTEDINLEVMVTVGEVAGVRTQYKRFFVNGVAKRRTDFVGNLPSVLFSPQDLELVGGSPGKRREFLDNVLEQTDRDYRIAHLGFIKALKQRNALLELVKETGRNADKQLDYWDSLVIRNGSVVTQKREKFINSLNEEEKSVFDFKIVYDKSEISKERLEKYYDAERASGVTLVGPQRDDVFIYFEKDKALKYFGSRGQQRLGVLQLKLIELNYIKEKLEEAPILLLDDIFSELDEEHINLILSIIGDQQTILTTTHEEFIPTSLKRKMEVIELEINK